MADKEILQPEISNTEPRAFFEFSTKQDLFTLERFFGGRLRNIVRGEGTKNVRIETIPDELAWAKGDNKTYEGPLDVRIVLNRDNKFLSWECGENKFILGITHGDPAYRVNGYTIYLSKAGAVSSSDSITERWKLEEKLWLSRGIQLAYHVKASISQ